MHYSPLTRRISGTGSQAWQVNNRAIERLRLGQDILLLSIGDPDFDTPPAIIDTAVESLRQGRTHYAPVNGELALREAVAARQLRLTGQVINPNSVVIFPGAQCALFSTVACLVGPGDEVLVIEPWYTTYEGVVGASGATLVSVPMSNQEGFRLDLAALAQAITPRSRVMVINSPNNPTGAVLNRSELEGIAKLCQQHDLILVIDAVYATLTYEVPYLCPTTLPGMAERTVIVDSVSKAYAMMGWRLGWAIAPGELPLHLANLAQCLLFGCPPFVQDAAVTALSQDFSEIEQMRAAFQSRRDLVVGRINRMPYLRCTKPEGAMFVFVDIRATGLDAIPFANRLLEEQGVAVIPGDGFGASARGYVRLSLGVSSEKLSQACDRIEAFLQALPTAIEAVAGAT